MAVSNVGNSATFEVSTPSDRDIRMTRLFDAPRELVFEAHTSCEHFVHWWGPPRYDVDCDIDFRVGGSWRIVIRSKDNELTFFGDYLEIEAPERERSVRVTEPRDVVRDVEPRIVDPARLSQTQRRVGETQPKAPV